MKKIVSELKSFMYKGNVLDLAVAIVVGAAFNAVVNSLANNIITPFISFFISDIPLDDLQSVMQHIDAAGNVTSQTVLEWGTFIRAVINFLVTALFVFFALKLILFIKKKIRQLEERAKEEAKRALAYFDGDPATPAPREKKKRGKKAEKAPEPQKEPDPPEETAEEKQEKLLAAILKNLESINGALAASGGDASETRDNSTTSDTDNNQTKESDGLK